MIEVKRPDGRIELIKIPDGKYRSCIVDTVSAPQNYLFQQVNEGKRTTLEEWRDFAWEVYNLYSKVKKLSQDVVIIQVLGIAGTGKTVGGKFLDPETNAWINSDNKRLSFKGAAQMYPIDNSRKNYSTSETYDDIFKNIKAIHDKRKGAFFVFMLGHLDNYKGKGELIYQKLRTLGKSATKLGVEELNVTATFYTLIKQDKSPIDPERYKLSPHSTGFDTARTPEGYFMDLEIPNNYQVIIDTFLEEFGELKPI